MRRAVDAMATSRTRHVLKQMESVGQWSGAVHDMSDALAAGTIAEALPALGGCPGVS